MMLPGIEEKVAFLKKPESYPGHVDRVETKQTHMSWIFLTDKNAWKLKKPVRMEYLDFSTPESRHRNCNREIRLNRRLAKDVYLGVIPLTSSRDGTLQLGGTGQRVDSLVLMRRLPEDQMLDHTIGCNAATEEILCLLASHLSAFYNELPPASITGSRYRRRLAADLTQALRELTSVDSEIQEHLGHELIESELVFLRENPGLFDARVRAGKIVEGHGDLRPEHICLQSPPVIIDCLEFDRTLRTLDTASELSFLALECERLGAPYAAKIVLQKYGEESGDRPPSALLAFYKVYHACVRAQIAIWHLKDARIPDRQHWIDKAKEYLKMAAPAIRAA
jgi:uncharacterized protein